MAEEKSGASALTLIPTDDKTKIEIIPFGTDEKIQLSVAIVQKMIAVPTRSGKQPDHTQCLKFMMLCKARHLNPFEGDAYLLGYDTQAGPQFSLITAHQVFLKRAEASEGFDGMTSGVIVKPKAGDVIEREGDLTFDDEQLLGGWAKVYRKDTTHPFYRRLKLATFSTGRSRWEKDPAGMIVKCAEADALRSAFPTHLGGLYVEEERPPLEIEATTIPRAQITANGGGNVAAGEKKKAEKSSTRKPKASLQIVTPTQAETPASAPQPEQSAVEPGHGPKAKELAERMASAGFQMTALLALAVQNKWLPAPEGYTGDLANIDAADLEGMVIPEAKAAEFLEPDNWETIEGVLGAK